MVRSQIGYLAEDQTMYGWMMPIELCHFLAPFYPTWDMDCARNYLDRFDIPQHARIGRLSKGQSVKLGLAVALAHRPPVVILDDPAMGLDPIARKEFNRDLVEHLQTAGCTVLYSSHLLDEVEAVADAVAIMDEGRIVRTGMTDDLRAEVKRFLLPSESVSRLVPPEGLLDIRRHGDRFVAPPTGHRWSLSRAWLRGRDCRNHGLPNDQRAGTYARLQRSACSRTRRKNDFTQHGHPLVYGVLAVAICLLGLVSSRLARPLQPTRWFVPTF